MIRTGGKLAKDVAGYDLTSLMVGSEGTLGIVTEAILKLVPKPTHNETLLAVFDSLEKAAETVSAIIAAKINSGHTRVLWIRERFKSWKVINKLVCHLMRKRFC